mmetsp:Transcript_13984/g.58393  ORF Transcript_13984/g.58393 Transcript_13984/m.58393 type:complete len:401 (+) Transcript_13984:115-1317(+)
MGGLDGANGAAFGPHDQARGQRAAGREAHALEQVAGGHAGRREEDLLAAAEVGGGHRGFQVEALVLEALGLGLVARPQLSLELAAEAAHGGGGDDALGRAPDAHEHVDVVARRGGRQRGGHVAVVDEVHARARPADVVDELRVAGAVEHRHRDVAHVLAQCVGDGLDVARDGRVDVDHAGGLVRHAQLVHVVGLARGEHGAALGERDHGDGAVLALRDERGAVERVDCDVHRRPAAVAEVLAAEQHRRLVLLALADDDLAVHDDRVEHEPHGIHRRLVRRALVAEAHPLRAVQRGRLRHAHELEREVAAHHAVVGSVRKARGPSPAATALAAARLAVGLLLGRRFGAVPAHGVGDGPLVPGVLPLQRSFEAALGAVREARHAHGALLLGGRGGAILRDRE